MEKMHFIVGSICTKDFDGEGVDSLFDSSRTYQISHFTQSSRSVVSIVGAAFKNVYNVHA